MAGSAADPQGVVHRPFQIVGGKQPLASRGTNPTHPIDKSFHRGGLSHGVGMIDSELFGVRIILEAVPKASMNDF